MSSVARADIGHEQPHRPRVSFAIPVRNGQRFLGRALDSLLAQDLDDIEVVVCDNASTDATPDLVRRYAERDPRVRYFRNPEDIGQIENFNRAFELSRGEYLRWMGADDWLEPSYARRCAAALDARPDAVGVTTQWRFMDDAGRVTTLDVRGPRADATTPTARLRLTLRLLQSGQPLLFDPVYSLLRRSAVERTRRLLIDPWTDRLLAVELCLLGSFCHLDDCLATRRSFFEKAEVRLPRYHRKLGTKRGHRAALYRGISEIVGLAPLSGPEKAACRAIVLAYWLRDLARRRTRWLARLLGRDGWGWKGAKASVSAPTIPLRIEPWYGKRQVFGQRGNPQRWVNLLGTVSGYGRLRSLECRVNGGTPQTTTVGQDNHRLAATGDFNFEIDRGGLAAGDNLVVIRAEDNDGRVAEETLAVEYHDGAAWPLPCAIEWRNVTNLQDAVQVVDGRWSSTEFGVRVMEPYYDRALALGDSAWRDYEVRTTVVVHGYASPTDGPPTYGVTHFAIALRWPGHDEDKHNPHRKWYPLGATCEFQLRESLQGCRWRILPGPTGDAEDASQRRAIEPGRVYAIAVQAQTLRPGATAYRAKLWPAGESEPPDWDLELIKEPETVERGSVLVVAHNADVTFGDIRVSPLES
jgi:glycosyltransferase involved in cell wall biosynthesis